MEMMIGAGKNVWQPARTHPSTPGLIARWVFSVHLYKHNKMVDDGTFVACLKTSLHRHLLKVP